MHAKGGVHDLWCYGILTLCDPVSISRQDAKNAKKKTGRLRGLWAALTLQSSCRINGAFGTASFRKLLGHHRPRVVPEECVYLLAALAETA
jgi:hypothetical protein